MRHKYKKGLIPTFLIVALVFTGAWGFTQYKIKRDYRTRLNSQYQRMFYDMKDNIETVQTSLGKALLSKSKESNILLLTQIYQQAYFAQEKLSQMPVKHKDLEKTSKFLNQVADYSFAMIQNHVNGKDLSDKQRQNLFKLKDYTQNFSSELQDIHDKIMKGRLNFNIVRRREDSKLKKANEDMLNTGLSKYEEDQMTQYPELIYDGPFSDKVLNIKPKGLGDKEVSKEEAIEIVKDFLGDKKVTKVTAFEEGENKKGANISAYTFSVSPKNKEKEQAIYIGVSKIGGKVIWMENPRKIKKKELSEKEAQKKALEFLKEKGYENMEPNYSLKYGDANLFNYAYKDGEVTVYTDLIKVKVALDDGEVIGYDASKYLKSHHKRDIPKPELTKEEAKESVRQDFDIENIRLTVIPSRGSKEVLCYEFSGKYMGSDYIVYINALNGREEQILQIIKDEDGTLMI
ncbi:MAG: germination protein YpeB [Firmicutes bacterium]|nr:germination protein YpeB [Bacillota bacterium]